MSEDIYPVAIEDKMRDAYLNYSLSVIIGRALPDARDGLKPVHRRILYATKELGLVSSKPHKKSARIVGEVLGKFHPHGDAAVYGAMVRMAQPFNQRYLLIDGHGNFGSIDGDSPAAMRYTEARLDQLAEELLANIDEDTVDFTENFDGSLEEPVVLPTRFPNLLVNGSSGIAVGMSTSIPPHNLSEVIEAILHLVDYPNAHLDTLMKHYLPGPDFPTGGKVIGNEGIIDAYRTGKGKITLRGKTKVEKIGRKEQLIIEEIPYQVNKSKLIEEIADLVKKGKLSHVTDLRDESDRSGLRIVIELKNNADTQLVLNRLFKYSSLQVSFRINLLALVDNKPVVLTLKQILNEFIKFRRNIITRFTKYNLKKDQDRYHILEGLEKAIDNLDLVIHIIRHAESREEAREKLKDGLRITERQAKAIMEMQLQRLVGIEIQKLQAEIKKLAEKIKYYKDILENSDKLNDVLKDDLREIRDQYCDNRKTVIIEDEEEAIIKKQDLIKEKEAVLSLSYRNNLKRSEDFNSLKAAKNDYLIDYAQGSSLDKLLFFTDAGEVYTQAIHQIEEHHGLSTGESLNNYLQIPLKETIRKMLIIPKNNMENKYFTFVTKQGQVKKTEYDEYDTNYTHIRAIKLNEDDLLVNVLPTDGNNNLIITTAKGFVIKFTESAVNPTGRNTLGSKGIKLSKNDKVINFHKQDQEKFLISFTNCGRANKINIDAIRKQQRNGKGMRIFSNTEYQLAGTILANPDDSILLSCEDNQLYTIKASEIYETAPGGNMYNAIKKFKSNKIINVNKIVNVES